jgi:hypothetical protein
MALTEATRVHGIMNRAANRALKTFLQKALRELIEKTPVRTGFAQSNWVASVGNVPTDPVGSKESVDYGPQQESFRVIRRYAPHQGELSIVNNCPYIELLNGGSSNQAPAGFVDEVLNRVIEEVGKSVLR